MPDFRGKVALVTGVGRAGQIGQAVARAFGRAGAKLVVADVNAAALAERAEELADGGCDVRAVAGDRTGPEAARRAVQMKDAKVRWVELDDLVAAVLYLASDGARAVTGEVLPVAGDV